MVTYNLIKNILENILEYLDKNDFTKAQEELFRLKKLLRSTINKIFNILRFLEINNFKIKKDIYNLIYYYLEDFVLLEEDALFTKIIDYKNKREIIIEPKLFSIKKKFKNRFEKEIEEIEEIEKYLDILYLIFKFLDFKLHKCEIEIKFSEIESKLSELKIKQKDKK
jgi:hypothetical protein